MPKNLINLEKITKMLDGLYEVSFFYTDPYNNQYLFLKPTYPEEIVKIISSGLDAIPISVIKLCADEVKDVLSHVINNSLK